MGELVQFVTRLHQATSRAYIDRMVDDKVHCMLRAKEYETDYWDGDRRYGYLRPRRCYAPAVAPGPSATRARTTPRTS